MSVRSTYLSLRRADRSTHFSILFRFAIQMSADELAGKFGRTR